MNLKVQTKSLNFTQFFSYSNEFKTTCSLAGTFGRYLSPKLFFRDCHTLIYNSKINLQENN